jgi:glutathione S-transferase
MVSLLLVASATSLMLPAARTIPDRHVSVRCSAGAPSATSDDVLFSPLEAKLADALAGYMLRPAQKPASAPEPTLPTIRHGLAPRAGVTFYRDGNAWCPFCERVWLQLLENGEEYGTVIVDIGAKKPPWYTDAVPTGQTPSAVVDGTVIWESLDIMVALEERKDTGARLLLPAEPDERARVVAELRAFDDPEKGLNVGGAGYAFMRGAPFGQVPDEGGESDAKVAALRAAFEQKLSRLEERLARVEDSPYFEAEFGVLDIALWPAMERMAAGLRAFRGYEIRDQSGFPRLSAWLHAMGERPAVARVRSDDGTLVRLFAKVFGMKGNRSWGDALVLVRGSKPALEAAAKLVRNRREVVDDILLHSQLGKGGLGGLSRSETAEVVEVAIALVAARLAAAPPPDVTRLIEDAQQRAAAAGVVCVALSFLRARVSAPRDMTAAAATALRRACAEEAAEAFDRFGYV